MPNPLHAAPLETEDYILTAVGLPDDTGKVLVIGDDINIEMPCASYDEAKDQVIRTANILDRGHDPIARADWFVEEHLPAMFKRLGAVPSTILLSDFETEVDLFFLKPEEKETNTLLLHRIGNEECACRIRERGIAVQFRLIRLKDYMDWLTMKRLANSPENRARFISGG